MSSLAWPSVVVIAVFLLRKQIVALLPRVRRVKYKDAEVELGEKLVELETRAEAAQLPDDSAAPEWAFTSPDDWTFGDYVERLAPISPRAAISEAWRGVEQALREIARRRGLDSRMSIARLARELTDTGQLPRDAAALVDDLRVLRNRAVHSDEFDIEPIQAVEFARLAERIIASVRLVDSSSPEGPEPG